VITLMTLTDAAKTLGVAASTLRAQVRTGKLTSVKIGGRNYVTPDEVARYRRDSQGKADAA
jgi:excisionase family DNA binding protein